MNRRQRKKHHRHTADKLRATIEAAVFDYLMGSGTFAQVDTPTLAGIVSELLPPITCKGYAIEVQLFGGLNKANGLAIGHNISKSLKMAKRIN